MSKRSVVTLITLIAIGAAALLAVFLAKGYTFSPKENRIIGTGIITITSTPDAASVFIDGHLTTATNATISTLSPKKYTIRIVKEGFIPWEKNIEVKEGLVTDLKVTLYPAIPTLYPLTFSGVRNPTLSPDGSKLAFIVTSGKKAGVWVWTMSTDRPIAFTRGAEPHQISQSTSTDYSKSILRWSPDSKQVLASTDTNNYLLDDGKLNNDPRDITAILQATLKSWDEDTKTADDARILGIKDVNSRKITSDSAIVRWAPDETKFLYGKIDKIKDGIISKLKVYNLETKKSYDFPDARLHFWLPDSRHVVLVEDNEISVVDYDGTNKAIVYAGKFDDSLVFAWPDSSRLVLVSSFPTPTASEPNLYGINLK